MKIILENLNKGARVTGVAKIVDGTTVLNNVPFNVGTKEELNIFVLNLLSIQTEFLSVTDGEFIPKQIIIKALTPLEIAKDKLLFVNQEVENGALKETEQEFIDAVVAYKNAKLII